jgi:hypothetical protein
MRKSLATIFEGGAYLTPSVARQIMKLFTDHSHSERMNRVKERFQLIFQKEKDRKKYREAGLTPMQTAVLGKIIDGKSTAQAAHELDIKEATVYTHIKAILFHTGCAQPGYVDPETMQQRGHICYFTKIFIFYPILGRFSLLNPHIFIESNTGERKISRVRTSKSLSQVGHTFQSWHNTPFRPA